MKNMKRFVVCALVLMMLCLSGVALAEHCKYGAEGSCDVIWWVNTENKQHARACRSHCENKEDPYSYVLVSDWASCTPDEGGECTVCHWDYEKDVTDADVEAYMVEYLYVLGIGPAVNMSQSGDKISLKFSQLYIDELEACGIYLPEKMYATTEYEIILKADEYDYTGEEVRPAGIRHSNAYVGNWLMELGVLDMSQLIYENNVEPGKATVSLTVTLDNWAGDPIVKTAVANFTILGDEPEGVKITTQPSGKTVAIGSYAKTSVAATGEGLTYQWYYKDPGSSSFSKGTCTSANYSVKMTQARNGRQIYCQIKDAYGNSVKTNTVTLDGYTALKITTQPKAQSAAFGTNARTSVAAVGEGKLTYQWYYKDPGQSAFTKGTCTSANYSVKMTEARNGRQIYCEIKDSRTSIKSKTVTLDGYTELKITTQPSGKTVAIGSSAKTSVKAVGEGTLTYQWYYKDPGQSSFTKGTCTSANYSVKMTEARNGRQIYCQITDERTSIKTNTVTLKAE